MTSTITPTLARRNVYTPSCFYSCMSRKKVKPVRRFVPVTRNHVSDSGEVCQHETRLDITDLVRTAITECNEKNRRDVIQRTRLPELAVGCYSCDIEPVVPFNVPDKYGVSGKILNVTARLAVQLLRKAREEYGHVQHSSGVLPTNKRKYSSVE